MHLSAGKEGGNQWRRRGGHRGIQTEFMGCRRSTQHGDLEGEGGIQEMLDKDRLHLISM